jgi:hypothetical protein
MALAGSGFVGCNSKGGIAGQCGGMSGCGGASQDEAAACNEAKGIWNGSAQGAARCTDGKGKNVAYTNPCG